MVKLARSTLLLVRRTRSFRERPHYNIVAVFIHRNLSTLSVSLTVISDDDFRWPNDGTRNSLSGIAAIILEGGSLPWSE